jgi:hypothetical protein
MVTLERQLTLHPKQLEVLMVEARFKVLVCGRRWGKTYFQASNVILAALRFTPYSGGFMEPIILVAMPTLRQARKILWGPVCAMLRSLAPEIVDRIDLGSSTIYLNFGLPRIVFEGLNDRDGDGVRGQRIYHACVDETQAVKGVVIEDVLLPALADTPGSTAIFTGTPPMGTKNILYNLYQNATTNSDWKSWTQTTESNPFVPKSELLRLKRILSPRTYDREINGLFVAFAGKIFESFNPASKAPDIDWERDAEFFILGHDCGDINPAYVRVSAVKQPYGYVFGVTHSKLFGDGTNAVSNNTVETELLDKWSLASRSKYCFVDPSRPLVIMNLRDCGISQASKGFNRINEGIQVVDSLFFQNRLFITDGAKHLEEKLTNYRRQTDKLGNILDSVAPGQDDHEIDSLRYALASLTRSILRYSPQLDIRSK